MVNVTEHSTVMSATTRSEAETVQMGAEFSRQLQQGDVVALYGELGSGKTQFVKGICQGLDVSEYVTSPTFTIINEYHGRLRVYHFDFYRIESLEEIYDLGFEEYLDNASICVIEWAEVAEKLLPPKRYEVVLKHGAAETERTIAVVKSKE
jgi:tRNA threonylcarbamoyladenosine biosynthesis protein TsaE